MTDDQNAPDLASLQQQLANLQTKLGEQGTELGQLREQNQSLTTQLASNQKPPAQPEGSGGGYDWVNGQMRDENGNIPETLFTAMEKAGASRDVTRRLVESQEANLDLATAWKNEKIGKTVGGEDQMNSLMEWANTNASNPKVTAASQLIGNLKTLDVGLEMLKSEAEASGFKFGGETTTPPANSEPSPLPNSTTGNINPTLTPLIPTDPATPGIVAEAYQSGDSNKVAEVESRLKLGMQQNA